MLVIGAPDEEWGDVRAAGQASLLTGDGMSGLVAPPNSTYVENYHAAACNSGQRFAWDLLPDRRLGGAFTFYTRFIGSSFDGFVSVPILAAPNAGADSGRAMIWEGCYSCAIFPKTNGTDSETGGRFGTSMAVATSGQTEILLVGSPSLGDGRVAIIPESTYRRWDLTSGSPPPLKYREGMESGVRQCQCDIQLNSNVGNYDCTPWSELWGAFPNEEFGASLATGDLDCDGFDDLAVGAPGATLPANGPQSIPHAGAVYVYRASGGTFGGMTPTVLRQGSFEVGGIPEENDRFGHAVVFGNFNGARRLSNDRSCYDLAVAVPGEDDGAGEIQIFEGSPNGLMYGGPVVRLDDIFDIASEPGDHFGYSLSAGDFNRDGFDDLLIGAPDHGGGVVAIVPGTSNGLSIEDATVVRQGNLFGGTDEAGDQFGYSLSWTNLSGGGKVPARGIVIGVPGENDERGQIRVYRTTDTPPNFGPVSVIEIAVLDQGFIYGDVRRHPWRPIRQLTDARARIPGTTVATMKPSGITNCALFVILSAASACQPPGPTSTDAGHDSLPSDQGEDVNPDEDPWKCGELGLTCVGPLGIGECRDGDAKHG